jgi:hypothetical protein
MHTGIIVLILLVILPMLFYLWHTQKTSGKRPDAYHDISARPVIPAVIIDIDMPFTSMVVFMFKLALAALPAIMLVAITLGILFSGALAWIRFNTGMI